MRLSLFILAITILATMIPQAAMADAILWDLIILASVEKNQLLAGESPVIFGKVVNHADKSVPGVKITIKIDSTKVFTETGKDGLFRYEVSEFQSTPGHYTLLISAKSSDGRMGYTSLDLDVKGDIAISQTANTIHTKEAQFYLNSDPKNFENDPMATKLYEYYQMQYKKFLKEEEAIKKINEYQIYLKQQKDMVKEVKQKEIEEENPGAGTYSGRNYNVFIDNLDPSVQDIMKNQLEHTKTVFQDAQNAMNEVLKNGGTIDEARKAYFEKAKIPREQMEELTKPLISITSNTTEALPIDSQDSKEESSESEPIIENFSVNGTASNLGNGITMISMYVNGTWIQFLINGTQITPLNANQK